MIGFWTVILILAAGVAVLLIASLIGHLRHGLKTRRASDLDIYRDQMRDIDRDVGRGIMARDEAERLRVEIGRRMLAADRMAAGDGDDGADTRPRLVLAVLFIALAVGAAVPLYARLGVPGHADMPIAERLAAADANLAERPSQADMVARLPAPPVVETDAEYDALMEQLRAQVDPATSSDPRGLALLVRNEALLNHFPAAEAAQRRLIDVLGPDAGAADHAMLAEILVRAAGNYVSPEAETELAAALAIDRDEVTALYYTGLMYAQAGRFDRAFDLWRRTIDQAPMGMAWFADLHEQIGRAAALAGVQYEPPPLPQDASDDS